MYKIVSIRKIKLENGIVKLSISLGLAAALSLALAADHLVSAQAGKKDPKKTAGVVPDWGQFRGPHRDGLSPDTGLLAQWPAGGPPLAWKVTGLGEGLSSVAVVGNKVFTMGDGFMLALDAATGKTLWKAPNGDTGKVAANQGGNGPRGTPACDGTAVYGITQNGVIIAHNAATGAELWRKKMSDFGGSVPTWGYSESPLIDGQMLLCTPGGSGGSVVALNKANGALAWQCKELKDPPHYTSITVAEIGKVPQYLVLTINTIAGIAKTGQLLWKADCKGATAVCSSPIYKDNFVFASCGYSIGCHGFQISGAANTGFKATQIYAEQNLQNHHGGAIVVGDHIYGQFDNGLKCVDIKTGKVVWQGGPGKGSLAVADGHLYCRDEGGGVTLVEASPDSYKEKGKFSLGKTTGIPAWANPVVFGGRLYLRDEDTMSVYNVSAAK